MIPWEMLLVGVVIGFVVAHLLKHDSWYWTCSKCGWDTREKRTKLGVLAAARKHKRSSWCEMRRRWVQDGETP